MTKPGSRVGVLIGVDHESKICDFLGYGVYEGDFPVDKEAGGFGPIKWQTYEEFSDLPKEERDLILLNPPRIRLDNGDICWGCEVWWGPEVRVKEMLNSLEASGYTIRTVRIADARAEAAKGGDR